MTAVEAFTPIFSGRISASTVISARAASNSGQCSKMKSTQQIPFINSRQHSAHRDALKAEDRCPCATQQSSFPIVALWQRLLLLKLRPRLGMLHQVLHRLRGEKPNSRFSQPSGCHITTSENDSPRMTAQDQRTQFDRLDRSRKGCAQCSARRGRVARYGMMGGIMETSASFEAHTAPRPHPTAHAASQIVSALALRYPLF